MEPNKVTGQIMDAAFKIQVELGPGLLETAYEIVLAHELKRSGLPVRRQVQVPIEMPSVMEEVQ